VNTRRLFLRWLLVNVLFALALAGAAVAYNGQVHQAALVAVSVVLLVYALAAGHAGRLAWRDDRRDHPHLLLAIEVTPMLSMLGTVAGFLIAFAGTAGDVQQRVLGASTGLISTFVGIACTAVLMLLRTLLTDAR
jgi:Na+/H+-translocating membrane pyrophosphatase